MTESLKRELRLVLAALLGILTGAAIYMLSM